MSIHVTTVLVLASAALAGGCIPEDPGLSATGDSYAELQAELPALREPGPCSVIFEEEAMIAASASTIWHLLVDLEGYARWNPWVVKASGDATPGSKVVVEVVMNGKIQRADHTIEIVEPEQRFCWTDAGWNSLFVYGQRCRTLEPRADGTVFFHQELLLDGIFAPLAKIFYGPALEAGMTAETQALQQASEAP